MRGWVVFAAAVSVLSVAGSAAAQDQPTSTKKGEVESWVFPDDSLLTVKPVSSDMLIGSRKGIVRTILTRPRTQFIPELLKTIEGL